jgi:hypothetical protein
MKTPWKRRKARLLAAAVETPPEVSVVKPEPVVEVPPVVVPDPPVPPLDIAAAKILAAHTELVDAYAQLAQRPDIATLVVDLGHGLAHVTEALKLPPAPTPVMPPVAPTPIPPVPVAPSYGHAIPTSELVRPPIVNRGDKSPFATDAQLVAITKLCGNNEVRAATFASDVLQRTVGLHELLAPDAKLVLDRLKRAKAKPAEEPKREPVQIPPIPPAPATRPGDEPTLTVPEVPTLRAVPDSPSPAAGVSRDEREPPVPTDISDRDVLVAYLEAARQYGLTLQGMAERLNEAGHRTVTGRRFTRQNVQRLPFEHQLTQAREAARLLVPTQTAPRKSWDRVRLGEWLIEARLNNTPPPSWDSLADLVTKLGLTARSGKLHNAGTLTYCRDLAIQRRAGRPPSADQEAG